MPNFTAHTREGDKPSVMLMLADCGMRDGLNEAQTQQLATLRLGVVSAYESLNRGNIRIAKTALLTFYQSLPEIKNGDAILTPQQACFGDLLRLKEAVKKYDPSDRHPNCGDLGYKR